MTITNADEARELFERSSQPVEQVLEQVGKAASENLRLLDMKGWLSDAVIKELTSRGFKVSLTYGLWAHTEIRW